MVSFFLSLNLFYWLSFINVAKWLLVARMNGLKATSKAKTENPLAYTPQQQFKKEIPNRWYRLRV